MSVIDKLNINGTEYSIGGGLDVSCMNGPQPNEDRWFIFARTTKDCTDGACGAVYLVAGAGNYGDFKQGAWIVNISARGQTPHMFVDQLAETNQAVKFGYRITSNEFQFGVHVGSWSIGIGVTVLFRASVDTPAIEVLSSKPAGWVEID